MNSTYLNSFKFDLIPNSKSSLARTQIEPVVKLIEKSL